MQRISAPGESTMAADLPASTSALSNRYDPGESSQSLLSRRGSSLYNSSRFLQVDDTGVYLTSLAITILITATVTILILLFTLIITLAILLASCQSKPDVVVKQGSRALDRVDVCRSFALNFELNNLRGNVVFPNTCEEYVFHYMRSGQYENDVKETVCQAISVIFFRIVRVSVVCVLKKMSQEKQHHHPFHHKKDEGTDVYAAGNAGNVDKYEKAKKEERQHQRREQMGGLGAVGTGAFALHEKHAAKKDPEQAHRHKIMSEIAATGALAGGGFVLHEHHEKKDSKKEEKEAEAKKHHHLF